MKLLIEFNSQLVLVDPTNSGPLLECLGNAKLLTTEGYGDDKKYIPDSGEISVKVFDESRLLPPSDPVKKLQEEKRVSDGRWIEYYNKSNALEKSLKALQEDLDARGISYPKA